MRGWRKLVPLLIASGMVAFQAYGVVIHDCLDPSQRRWSVCGHDAHLILGIIVLVMATFWVVELRES
ncbi:MAG: hypothetical protein ACXWP5_08270 [Bdellovibrionota bacterium]